jgi:hypothetical protein
MKRNRKTLSWGRPTDRPELLREAMKLMIERGEAEITYDAQGREMWGLTAKGLRSVGNHSAAGAKDWLQ